jgi:hypothetical protein
MNLIEWLNIIPSVMSAIAAIAATYAAFVALSVSRKANSISEKSILAVHHHNAVSVLSSSIDRLRKETKSLSEFSYTIWVDWSREIELKDERGNGGLNPRPLRHVLSNGGEMLVMHATRNGTQYRNAGRLMFSIIREGVSDLNEREYNSLLRKADGAYNNFECTFGSPLLSKNIGEADAFRWVIYQLTKRINRDDRNKIWRNAWLAEGWLTKYRAEFSKVKSIFEDVVDSLRAEKSKIIYSVLPLQSNSVLHRKYEMVLSGVEVLLSDCGLEALEHYKDWRHDEDVAQLILYSIAMSYLVMKILDSICLIDELDM